MISKKAIFEGKVEGVGLRYTAKETSKGFDIVGWVKNLPTGTVELCHMGEEVVVDEFLKVIHE